jgi:hypothetical protein
MDDQNIHVNSIPDRFMVELLDRSELRLGISRELCNTYEEKYGYKFYLLPPVIPGELIRERVESFPDNDPGARPGILIGNLWSQRWLERLRSLTRETGYKIDWYGNPRDGSISPDWSTKDEIELQREGITVKGYLPETQLVDYLRAAPYAVIPTGESDEPSDRPEIAKLSLPSRLPFIVATSNTPIIVLGRTDSVAARFVNYFGIGKVAGYAPDNFQSAVEQVCQLENQLKFRERAAGIASVFSSAGIANWIWQSLACGNPIDSRFEDLIP